MHREDEQLPKLRLTAPALIMPRKLYIPILTALLLALLHVAGGSVSAQHQTDFAITSPKQGEKVPQREIAVRGTGAPGAKAIWDRGRLRADVVATVDEGGRWSITVPLDEGRNEFTFRQENPDEGPLKLTVVYEVLPGQADPTDTSVGVGPFQVDLSDWALKFLYGAWNAAGGDEIEGLGSQLAALMLTNPDPTVAGDGMAGLQGVVDALIAFSLSLITVMFVISVWRFSYGNLQQPQSALYKLAGAIFLLGFYRTLFRYVIGASNAATYTILGGSTRGGANLTELLAHIAPTTALWVIAGLLALVFVLMLGFLRVLGILYILVLYALGPLMIPMILDESTASYFAFWWRSLIRVLAWSVVWAVEMRLFDAVLVMGSTGGVAETFLAPFAAMGTLFVMFKTPKLLPGPTPTDGLQMVSRQVSGMAVGKVAGRGAAVAKKAGAVVMTGGTGAVAQGGATLGRVATAGITRLSAGRNR
jgi:hypothetical protein